MAPRLALDLPPSLWPAFFRLVFGTDSPQLDTPADAHRLATFANQEGLLGLLFRDAALPAAIAERLRIAGALEALNRRRVELQTDALQRLHGILGDGGWLVLKGADYRWRLYAEPELRPSGDLDVYVIPEAFDSALARVREAGFEFLPAFRPHGADYYEVCFDLGEVRVELHRTFGVPTRTSVDYAALWRDRETFELRGMQLARISPLHALAAHALTLAKDEMAGQMIRYVDLWQMLRRWGGRLEEVVAIARAWGVERALYASLRILTQLFPEGRTEAVEQTMDSLLSPSARRFLDRFVLPDRTRSLSGHVDGRLVQFWRKYWLTDGMRRRAAMAAAEIPWLLRSA